jgi:hypothetical protein
MRRGNALMQGCGSALEAGPSATPAHPWRRREARRLLGTVGGISVKPEDFSAKPSG